MFTETPPECNTKIKHDLKDALKNNFHRKDAKNSFQYPLEGYAKEIGTKGKTVHVVRNLDRRYSR